MTRESWLNATRKENQETIEINSLDTISLLWQFWVWKDTHISFISKISKFKEFNLKKTLDSDKSIASNYLGKSVLIPDKEVFRVLDGFDLKKHILNWFPRTLAQAEYISKRYKNNILIVLESDFNLIKSRLLSRLMCNTCFKTYAWGEYINIGMQCSIDDCNWILIKRREDNETNIKERQEFYLNEIEPLIKVMSERMTTIIIKLWSWSINENNELIEYELNKYFRF